MISLKYLKVKMPKKKSSTTFSNVSVGKWSDITCQLELSECVMMTNKVIIIRLISVISTSCPHITNHCFPDLTSWSWLADDTNKQLWQVSLHVFMSLIQITDFSLLFQDQFLPVILHTLLSVWKLEITRKLTRAVSYLPLLVSIFPFPILETTTWAV